MTIRKGNLPLWFIAFVLPHFSFAKCNSSGKQAIDTKQALKLSILGEATSQHTDGSYSTSSCYRNFKGGVIYYSDGVGAFESHGLILERWKNLGFDKSVIGIPTTDESTTPDTFGRYNHFTKGSIYYRPCIGAFEIHGLIRQRWAQMGWEKSALGYPLSDELKATDGIGRYSVFQHGAIYYHPSFGANPISGSIYRTWKDLGGLTGTVTGYPKAGPLCFNTYCDQSFERGDLNTAKAPMLNRVDLVAEIGRRGITIRNQSPRPTCSVFTMTFLLDWAYSEMCGNHLALLSEEYLNHAANLATGKNDDGDFFDNIHQGYEKYGMVIDSLMPYQTSYNFSSFSFPTTLTNKGKQLLAKGLKFKGSFIKPLDGTTGLSDAQMAKIISYLDKGIPVGVGRAHSMPIVGYQKDTTQPGGGTFTFRNSYGVGTGTNGYQAESFQSVKTSAGDVFVYE